MMRKLRFSRTDDSGMGLILIIGVSVLIFALAGAATAVAVNGISQSRQRTSFEVSLATAELGVDRALSDVQAAYTHFGVDYPIPGPVSAAEPAPWCAGTAVQYPTAGNGAGGVFYDEPGVTAEQAERDWARAQIALLPASCIQTDESGEYLVLKPVSANPKYGKIYALSALPSFADSERTRLVKAEYIFMPYRPTHAILSGGDLEISSSTLVRPAAGVDPNTAGVHSNGVITGSGNPEVQGLVTSTGTSSFASSRFYGGSVAQTPKVALPFVSARQFYMTAQEKDPEAIADWYDLCAGGQVRPYSSSGPCTSATLTGTANASQEVRGWGFDAGSNTWIASRNALPGTYYAHRADINVGTGNATFTKMTVIAEAQNAGDCATKVYGNITWDHYELSAPAYQNMFMLADTDIITASNFSAGSEGPPAVSGMYVAGDQIDMSTSSQGAVGAVLAADQCESPPSRGLITASVVKNPAVYFDPNAESPFSSVVTVTLWLDYTGG